MSVPSHPAGVALGRFERERPADRASARSISLPAWAPSLLIAFLLTVPAWGPVVLPSFNLWTLFDGSSHMSKAFALGQLIEQGNWYPRWVPSFYGGYGYPTFNYYGPLTYYLTLLVKLLWPARGLYVAFQLVCAFSALSILGALYFLCWRMWRHGPAAVLATASLAYAPYVFPNNLLLSGWVPQLLGMGWIFWLVAACFCLWQNTVEGKPARRWWWAVALLTAAALFTHNPSSEIGAAVVLAWLVALWVWRRSGRAALYATGAAAVGALLAAVLWVPALLEQSLVQIERMNRGELNYRNQFMRWPGIEPPLWGLQTRSVYTVGTPLDLHLIYPHSAYAVTKLSVWQGVLLAFVVFAMLAAVGRWRAARGAGLPKGTGAASRRAERRLHLGGVCFGLLLFLFGYSQSFDWWLPLWEKYLVLRAIQLPARFLVPGLYGLGVATAGAVVLLARPGKVVWAVALVGALALFATGTPKRILHIDPGISHSMGLQQMLDLQRTVPGYSASTEEFLPRTANYDVFLDTEARGFWIYERVYPEASWLGGRMSVWQGAVAVHGVSGAALWTQADVDVGSVGGTLALHQLFFPGWRAWIDGRPALLRVTPRNGGQAIQPGFILLDLPPGAHHVAFRFGPDGPRLAGAAVSLATLVGIGLWLVFDARRLQRLWRSGARLARERFAHQRLRDAVQSASAGRGQSPAALAVGGAVVLGAALVMGVRLLLPLGAPGSPSPADAVLVRNITDEVLAGRAVINSPSGTALGADKFVDVRSLTIQAQDRPLRDAGPSTRRWLFTHPPTEVAVDLRLPADAYFQTGLGLDPAVWETPTGDGVRYVVTVAPSGGEPVTILDQSVNPRARGEQRRWLDEVVDLRPWAGQQVRLTLHTDFRQDPTYDWAGWSEPSVVRLDPMTAARLLQSTAETAKVALGA